MHRGYGIDQCNVVSLFGRYTQLKCGLVQCPLKRGTSLKFAVGGSRSVIVFAGSDVHLSERVFALTRRLKRTILRVRTSSSFVSSDVAVTSEDASRQRRRTGCFTTYLLVPSSRISHFFSLRLSSVRGGKLATVSVTGVVSRFGIDFSVTLGHLSDLKGVANGRGTLLSYRHGGAEINGLLGDTNKGTELGRTDRRVSVPFRCVSCMVCGCGRSTVPIRALRGILRYCRLDVSSVDSELVRGGRRRSSLGSLVKNLRS